MELPWVDRDSLVKILQRQRDLPWTILETDRCVVREFVPEDLDAIYDLYDSEAKRFLEAPCSDRNKEREILRSYIRRVYRLGGYGDWAVISKATGALIGRMGYSFPSSSSPDADAEVTFGYLLRADWRGLGITREVGASILAYGFTMLGFEVVGADADISNIASDKILRYFGFLPVAEEKNQRYYRLKKEDWTKRRLL
jgi:RimJ/RimL family protein N-acetyltransferase